MSCNFGVPTGGVELRLFLLCHFGQTFANNFIILNTELSLELIQEGLARETVSKVQNLRKTKEFDITDRINLYYNGDNEFVDALNNYMDYIKAETLAVDVIVKDNLERYNRK